MRKKYKKRFLMGLIALLIVSCIFGYVDYTRSKNGKEPLFTIKITGFKTHISYYGFGYKFVRTPSISNDEPFYMASNLKFGFWFYATPMKMKSKEEITKDDFTVEVVAYENCDMKQQLYTSLDDKNYYLYCVNEIYLHYKDQTLTLKEALEQEVTSLQTITSVMKRTVPDEKEATILYKDKGSVIYRSNGKKEKVTSNLSILKCDTLAGNKDYYLGTKALTYENYFCTRTCLFTQTYEVVQIIESKATETTILLKRDDEEYQVTIDKDYMDTFEEGQMYEFTFSKSEEVKFDDTIATIFEQATLNTITLSEKDEKWQEAICS